MLSTLAAGSEKEGEAHTQAAAVAAAAPTS